MIFKQKELLSNVSALFKLNGTISFVENGNFNFGVEKFHISPMLCKIDISNKTIWVKDNFWDNYSLNLLNNSIDKLDFSLGLNGLVKDIIIIFKNEKLSCFSASQRKIIVNFPQIENIKHYLDYRNRLFFQNQNTIKSLSFYTGEYEWELDLQEKIGQHDTIEKMYGVVNDLLWLVSERGVLFGININDGKVTHHLNFDGYNTFQQYGTVQMQYFRSLYDENQQLLIGFYEHLFWQIDLKDDNPILKIENTKKINPVYYIEEFASPEGMAFDENYIYFRDNELATVGVLNRKTKKIEWQERLYDSPAVINDLQVSTDKLYALDTMGVLHIFEKETIE